MKKTTTSTLLLLSFFIMIQCADQPTGKKSRFTMAQDSELTLLMREMYTYYDSVKVDIKNGTLKEQIKTFQDVHSAVATSPAKSSSELYKAMATVYSKSAMQVNNPEFDKIQSFNSMVDNCMNCHQQMCPGPMVKIEKLYIK